jgi:gamma-glutamyltranspeptidase
LIVFNQKSLFFGGVHAIVKEKEILIGVADARREGVVI